MFNKRESSTTEDEARPVPEPVRRESANGSRAVIGASIQVDGTLRGDEDLVIEGKVKGTVELKKNSVTIGASGEVKADVYAHTIYVDGRMEGNLVASERIVVRKSAEIRGSITAPRVSLDDGARFNGSIDMDPETEQLKKAFSPRHASQPPKPATPPVSGKPDVNGADKASQAGA
jgi:cytoskeletal protein CcmA (bactofilin family)